LVCERAFQQYTDSVVSGQVSCGCKSYVFTNPKVSEMVYLREDKEVPRNRTLDLIQFLAKVFHKDFLEVATQLYRLLTDDLEALIQLFQRILGDECPRFQRFFNLRVLRHLANFFVKFGRSFRVLSYVAQERQKDFLRISSWHDFLLL